MFHVRCSRHGRCDLRPSRLAGAAPGAGQRRASGQHPHRGEGQHRGSERHGVERCDKHVWRAHSGAGGQGNEDDGVEHKQAA